jgi:regulator of protease activity HflC (stomatin/prohibitin superfamily)
VNRNKTIKLITTGVILIIAGIMLPRCTETVDAREIVIKRGFFNGALTVWSQPGIYLQNFGALTRYPKSQQASFLAPKKDDQAGIPDNSIKVRFNDGGHAQISISMRVDMPMDDTSIIKLHTKYGSDDSVMNDLVRTQVTKVVYGTGPLMSSKESYADKRNDLLQYIEDQLLHGIYKTEARDVEITDALGKKTVTVVKIIADPKAPGGFARQETSAITDFGLKIYGLSITSIDYDSVVEQQIKQQQDAIMSVQTAIAQAKQAEQKAFTITKQGEAQAAEAMWKQKTANATDIAKAEKDKAVAVTAAEKARDVAKLEQEAAGYKKQALILEGEGEAQKRHAIMQADGALTLKTDAWKEVNLAWAKAFTGVRLVPEVQLATGGGGGGGNTAASALVELLMAQTAKNLALNITPPLEKK